MAYTLGRCSNVDYCTLASTKRDIEVPVGEDFICPECGRPLRPPPTRESSAGVKVAVAGGAVALLLIGGGIYAGYRLNLPAPQAASPPMASPPPAVPVSAPPQASAATGPTSTPAGATPPGPTSPTSAAPTSATLNSTPGATIPAAAMPVAAPALPDPTILLRMAGASSLGADFAPKLAAAYLASLGDTGITTKPGPRPGEVLITGQRLSRPEAISITNSLGTDGGSTAGLAALGRNASDVAMSARRISPQERESLRAMGDLTSAAGEHAIGFQGEAVIVNPNNPINRLTMAQLAGILSGRAVSWTALGGTGQNIHLLREPGDIGLSDVVPGAPDSTPGERRVEHAAAAVVHDPDAIAIVPIGHEGQAKKLAVAAIGSAPVMPTPANIADEAYPMARRLYFYTAPNAANPFIARLAAFAVSPDGQAVLTQAGLVPLTVAAEVAPAPLTSKDRYKKLVTGTKRLAADLHFEANSNKLDLHSSREVDRVWNFMMSDHTPSDHLILIGFADNQGTPEANLALSRQRAQAVAEVFTRRGLPPGQIEAFGSELPIADNGTEDGRLKNRRVEVFLRP